MDTEKFLELFETLPADKRTELLAQLVAINHDASARERAIENIKLAKVDKVEYMDDTDNHREGITNDDLRKEQGEFHNDVKLLKHLPADSPIIQSVIATIKDIQDKAYDSQEYFNLSNEAIRKGCGIKHKAYLDVVTGRKTFNMYLKEHTEVYKPLLLQRLRKNLIGYRGFWDTRRGRGRSLQNLADDLKDIIQSKQAPMLEGHVGIDYAHQLAACLQMPIDEFGTTQKQDLAAKLLDNIDEVLEGVMEWLSSTVHIEVLIWILLKPPGLTGADLLYLDTTEAFKLFEKSTLYAIMKKKIPHTLDHIIDYIAQLPVGHQMEELLILNLGAYVRKARLRKAFGNLGFYTLRQAKHIGGDYLEDTCMKVRKNLSVFLDEFESTIPPELRQGLSDICFSLESCNVDINDIRDIDTKFARYFAGEGDNVSVYPQPRHDLPRRVPHTIYQIFTPEELIPNAVANIPVRDLEEHNNSLLRVLNDKVTCSTRCDSDAMQTAVILREYLRKIQ